MLSVTATAHGKAQAEESSGFLPTQDPRWVIVKFRKEFAVEWDGNSFLDASGQGVELPRGENPRYEVTRVFDQEPSISRKMEARLGSLPDTRSSLDSYFTITSTRAEVASQVLESLRADPRVEEAHVPMLPPPSPTATGTPDFSALQTNLGGYTGPFPFPTPLRVRPLWDMPGGTGAGVSFVDIEYNWRLNHEDLPSSISVLGPTPRIPAGLNVAAETSHGTASLGVVAGQHNGYGIDGIAPDATVSVAGSYTDLGQPYEVNVARAIDRARVALSSGDVMLLEAQIGGPNWTNPSLQNGLVPVEWQQVVFDAIKAATDLGIIVIEAAGNGSENLDAAVYGGKFNRTQRDSGAVLVTSVEAGPTIPAPGPPPPFSNIGSRVDLFWWDYAVVTSGYGDLQDNANDDLDYTQSIYAMSSAASAQVAGGVVSLQGVMRAMLGTPLAAADMRNMLVQTGVVEASEGTGIGVRPNFLGVVNDVLWNRLGINTGLAGPILNPCFEVTSPLNGAPYNWNYNFRTLATVTGTGTILPTHRDRMAFLEDILADGEPAFLSGTFQLPFGFDALALDWYFLTIDSENPCDVVTLSISIKDPDTGLSYPMTDLNYCDPLTAENPYHSFDLISGWRTTYSADLTGLAGKDLELRLELNTTGAVRAIVLLDHVRFETLASPSLSGIQPANGSICGGETVVVQGENFSGADTQVLIGGKPLVNPRWVDSGTIIGETPPGSAAASVAVSVTNGLGTAELGSAYEYDDETCGPFFRRGDCNSDGAMDLSDAIYSLANQFQGGPASACDKSCDANDDGTIDLSDPIFELGYLYSGGPQPPAPFPGCGTDATSDLLPCLGGSCP